MFYDGITWDIAGRPDQEFCGADPRMTREEQPGNMLRGWWMALLLTWFIMLLVFTASTRSMGVSVQGGGPYVTVGELWAVRGLKMEAALGRFSSHPDIININGGRAWWVLEVWFNGWKYDKHLVFPRKQKISLCTSCKTFWIEGPFWSGRGEV